MNKTVVCLKWGQNLYNAEYVNRLCWVLACLIVKNIKRIIAN